MKNQSSERHDNITFGCFEELLFYQPPFADYNSLRFLENKCTFAENAVWTVYSDVLSVLRRKNIFFNNKLSAASEKMENLLKIHKTAESHIKAGGYCRKCGRDHWLGPGNTAFFCRELMRRLERLKTIDLFTQKTEDQRALETSLLFGPSRGKMFGVMECLAPDGTAKILYAFSGQYNGIWLVDGWVPPLFDLDEFFILTTEKEKQIKQLGRTIDQCLPHSENWLAQRKRRRLLSRKLMVDIHTLYKLTNFRGETASLKEAFIGGNNGIPTGTGDCCAPKLLNYAAKNNLQPLGISEFFWGKENRSGEHRHGAFTASCTEKCQPILGFILCGLDT